MKRSTRNLPAEDVPKTKGTDYGAGVAINALKSRSRSDQFHGSGTKEGKDIVFPDASAFRAQLDLCLAFLRSLVEAMVQATIDLHFGRTYFGSIILRLDNELVRLEIWSADIGANDSDFGKPNHSLAQTSNQVESYDLEVVRYMTSILLDLTSCLREIQTKMMLMRPLIEKLAEAPFNNA